jgi:hypothetical protein
MKRHGHNNLTLKTFFNNVLSQLPPQRPCQRNAAGVFQVMQDPAHRICEYKQRSRKVKRVIAPPAVPAKAFYDGSRHPALRAEWPRHRFQPGPALGTRGRPSSLKDSRLAENARLGKEKIQDRVDHGCLSSTQRATLIYFE